jgi:formylmethanofuran dehydrogenase subunit E
MVQKDRKGFIDPKILEMMEKSEQFHGHSCPGLAIGVVVSKIALKHAKRSADEELVAIVENDACGIDAIQALTGCTFGKGNLIHNDYGKSVYTFYNRKSGKAIRLSLKPEMFSTEDELSKHRKVLFDKVRSGSATEQEIEEHNRLRQERIVEILRDNEEIFDIKDVEISPPDKARIFNDIICDNCGEPAMAARIREKDGKNYCIPCFKKIY